MQTNPFELFPEKVKVNGAEYRVETDYRFGIALELEAYSEDGADVPGLLRDFYLGRIPSDVNAAVDAMLDFYKGYEHTLGKKEGASRHGRWYDFRQDADVLLASFLDAYGVDLTTAEMHWWTFRLLMFNLPQESAFMRRIHYRTADISKVDKKLQPHYRKMKSLYALKQTSGEPMTIEERNAALKAKVQKRFEEATKYAEELTEKR